MTSPEMVEYMLKANKFSPEAYIGAKSVEVGFGHKVPRTWLIKEVGMTEQEALEIFYKDLKKIESNPLISHLKDTNQTLFDVSVHFIYDLGIQVYRNCFLDVLCEKQDFKAIADVLAKAIEYYERYGTAENREHDLNLIRQEGKISGSKKRVVKKNAGFSG